MINLENYLWTAFLKSNTFYTQRIFYMTKAYRGTWQYGVLRGLSNLGFCGNLIIIKNFLAIWQFQGPIGGFLSSFYVQEGVPQGSVLSVIFFAIKRSNILTQLPPSVKRDRYGDNFRIIYIGQNIRFIER